MFLKLITPVGCHGQSAMDLWMVLKIDYSSWVPWTECHGPLDGSQDYIMIIGEFSTSSKDDSAAHILQITKWSNWKSKDMKISEKKKFMVWAKKIGDQNCNHNNYEP